MNNKILRVTPLSIISSILIFLLYSNVIADCKPYQAFVPEDVVTKQFLANQEFGSVDIIYSNVIDPNKDSIVNKNTFIQELQKNKPSSDMVVLDWEGSTFKILKEDGIASKEQLALQEDVLSQYEIALNILSMHLKPGTPSGYYDVPSKKLSNKKSPIHEGLAIKKLQNEVEAFFPSGYLSQGRAQRSNAKVVLKYLGKALEEACKVGADAYVFVNHRWHKRSKKQPLEFIPISRFSKYIQDITEIKSGSCKYSGIIWWSADFRLNARDNKVIVKDVTRYNNKYIDYVVGDLKKYADVVTQYCQ